MQRVVTEEFNFDNAGLLTVEQVKEKLLKLEYIQNELKGEANLV